MAIDLLGIMPSVVSRDLSGYITFLYGPAKVGKTTFGSKMPGHLIIGFERGTNALPGVMVQPVTSWAEFKQVVRELKKPAVQEKYKSLIIDTADIAADACQKYICNQLGIENIGDGGWSTNGWARYKKEFEETFRSLAQLGYAIVFISHDKEKTIKLQNNPEYQQIGSSMQSSALSIVENMSDIIAYAHPIMQADGGFKRVLTLRSLDNSIRCGCRFGKIAPEIDFSYDALTKALNDAIDAEANDVGDKYITEERITPTEIVELDFDKLMSEFQDVVGKIMQTNPNTNGPKIQQIIERYLGKGKKVTEATRDQVELINLIVIELKEDLL